MRRASLLMLAVVALGCGPAPGDDVMSGAVVNGTTVATCGWPSAVLTDGCSGALVHPRVMITAAHCVKEGIARVLFGETSGHPAKTISVSKCTAHPAYNGDTDDIGVCTLLNPVNGLPIVPVMAACEEAQLTAGAPIMEVGFGQFVRITGDNDGFGTKRWMAGTIRSVATARGQIDVTTGSQDGEYYGDSGGPLFFQMPDGTWRVAGVDSASPDIVAGSIAPRVSTYTSVASHVAWLEMTTGIDLTPCHDASGWNPSATCTAITSNAGDGKGAWDTTCAGQTLIPPQPTCGGVATGGMGGPPGSGGAAGSGGAGGNVSDASGGAPATGSGGSGPGANGPPGGCSCTTVARTSAGAWPASILFLLLGVRARRGRR